MKRTLLVLAVLFAAGIFSAKAQNSSDSAFVRDLYINYINASSMPATASGNLAITADGKILKDLRPNRRAVAYTFVLSSSKKIDIKLSSGSWDSYLYVLDANYDTVVFNDDWAGRGINSGSRLIHDFPAGQYYIIVSEFSAGTSSTTYTLTMDEMATNFTAMNALTYTPLTPGTPVTDTLRTSEGPVVNNYFAQFYRASYARAYTMQINTPSVFTANIDRSNRLYYLYDNNYNRHSTNTIRTPGTYRLLVFSKYNFDDDTSAATPFTLTTTVSPLVDFNTLTYIPLGTFNDTTVNDTFSTSYQRIEYTYGLGLAKGYSFQGTQGKVVSIIDNSNSTLYVLMDNNYNILKSCWGRIHEQLPQTGTYYLAAICYNEHIIDTKITIQNFQTYYVDGVNGNDSRNGLTTSTAFATLDTAFARSGGIGKFYLTENYTFSGHELHPVYAHIYPYQKDIRLYMPTNYNSHQFYISNYATLIFGEQGGNYYFIVDSNTNDGFLNFIYAYGKGEVNNMKISNSYFPREFLKANDDLVIRNCEFVNDSFNYNFVAFTCDSATMNLENTTVSQCKSNGYLFSANRLNLTMRNSTISQNIFQGLFCIFSNRTLTMENTNVTGNRFETPVQIWNHSTANIISGSWRNNTLKAEFLNNNPNVSAQNQAGIVVGVASTLTFGAGFTMDVNNYLCADTSSTINITGNITAPLAAQFYPFKLASGMMAADYYEGRRVLSGSASLLASNYQKFSLAQADNSALWYIHPDGTIHTSPASIDQAEEGTISLYPNPANDVLNIALQGTEVNEVVVIDIYGKTVARTAVAEGNNTLDISALPVGMYFVQLRADNNVKATQKIVKR